MKLIFTLFLLISFNGFAQISYVEGYFIDNNNNKVVCLIKNEDWLRTPESITYKRNATDEPATLKKTEMREFSVLHNKYVRALVKMDTSSQSNKNLTMTRKPLWSNRDVLLKVLVEGKAKLYYYDNKDLVLFFFSVDSSGIEQLEYKSYMSTDRASDQLKVVKNLTYINQLKTQVSCGTEFSKISTSKMKYTRDFLMDYFERYNTCSGGENIIHKRSTVQSKMFHLKVTPGIDFSAAKVESVNPPDQEFPSRQPNFRIGVEAEFILPFNNNKWSLTIEPTYQQYQNDLAVPITYKSIELPLGLRHYFYLNKDLRLFINGAFVVDLPLEHTAEFSNFTLDTKRPKVNFAFGLGLNYKRLTLEGRYYTIRTGLDSTGSYHFDFTKASVIFGYRLF